MAEMGQVPLAAIMAKAHNLTEYIPKLEEQLEGSDVSVHIPPNARLLIPPTPLCRGTTGDAANWPLLRSTKKIFSESTFESAQAPPEPTFMDAHGTPEDTGEGAGGWGDDDDMNLGGDLGADGATMTT